MPISLTHLRANLYKIVDEALETGNPVEIERHGQRIKLIPMKKKSKLSNLVKHPGTINGNPEDLVHLDWTHEWKGKE